jgi:hypothetical protein
MKEASNGVGDERRWIDGFATPRHPQRSSSRPATRKAMKVLTGSIRSPRELQSDYLSPFEQLHPNEHVLSGRVSSLEHVLMTVPPYEIPACWGVERIRAVPGSDHDTHAVVSSSPD